MKKLVNKIETIGNKYPNLTTAALVILILILLAIVNRIIKNIFELFINMDAKYLGFWGAIIGSIIGVLGVYLVTSHQLKKLKDSNRPILVVNSSKNIILEEGKKLDKIFTLINGGESPIFNLSACLKISFDQSSDYQEEKEFMITLPYKEHSFGISDTLVDKIQEFNKRDLLISLICKYEDKNGKIYSQEYKFTFANVTNNSEDQVIYNIERC
ncbi:hypothetical protein BG261_08135 [Floricoccus tropicus]|uniref:Uncharacterized protein n=1 Tax=Floricoccus tropicus TaxID=1859473 RepID=A0A1E8GIY8_9LACT|nr:hypothetical protein [Floricoccus tropicus]OFI48242.1 hypothetical protein BG261_08135 [Floricoccus tropicus]